LAITPMDIHRHEFSTSRLGGYKAVEVDAFLDQLANELEMLLQRNHEMNEALEEMREQLREYDSMQQTIQNAFINAQKSADALVQDAKNQAEAILAEARKKGDSMLAGLRGEKEKMEASFGDVKQMVASYIGAARELLEKQLQGLKQFEGTGLAQMKARDPEPARAKPAPEPLSDMPIAEMPLPAAPAGTTTAAPPITAPEPAETTVTGMAEPEGPGMPPVGVETMAVPEIEQAAQAALGDLEPVVPEEPPMFEATSEVEMEVDAEADELEGKRKRHFFWE